MKRVLLVMMLVPSILTAGTQTRPTEPKPGMSMPGMMMSCPMKLEGTTVAVADTPTGITVSITTKPENVAEVRRRVEMMATMHNTNRPNDAMMQGQMMPGTIKYEAIENGARLTLTPRDTAKLIEFRKQVRAHVERMQKGECGMMGDMMQGMMQGMSGMDKKEVKPGPEEDEKDHSAHHPEDRK